MSDKAILQDFAAVLSFLVPVLVVQAFVFSAWMRNNLLTVGMRPFFPSY